MTPGFKKETNSTTRLEAMKAFCARYQGPTAVAFGNDYTGPYTKRELKQTSYAEFANQDAVREFLEVAENVVEVEGTAVTVKKAKTKVAKERDWALYLARDKLQAEDTTKKVELHTDKGRRTVTVDGVEAFVQQKQDSRGSFEGSFAHLALPS